MTDRNEKKRLATRLMKGVVKKRKENAAGPSVLYTESDISEVSETDQDFFASQTIQESINPELVDTARDDLIASDQEVSDDEDELNFISSDMKDPESYLKLSVPNFLRAWIVYYNIKRSAADVLIKYFHVNCDKSLPRSCRTLLSTPRKAEVVPLGDGMYSHFGLLQSIENSDALKKISQKKLILDFSIDGLDVTRGSKSTMWPIQGSVRGMKMKPFVVGMYYGENKPVNFDDYLLPFVKELKDLTESKQVKIGNFNVEIEIGNFIMDTPARSDVTGVKLASGYFGCPRCQIKGYWSESNYLII